MGQITARISCWWGRLVAVCLCWQINWSERYKVCFNNLQPLSLIGASWFKKKNQKVENGDNWQPGVNLYLNVMPKEKKMFFVSSSQLWRKLCELKEDRQKHDFVMGFLFNCDSTTSGSHNSTPERKQSKPKEVLLVMFINRPTLQLCRNIFIKMSLHLWM